jgi:hypothetical protein
MGSPGKKQEEFLTVCRETSKVFLDSARSLMLQYTGEISHFGAQRKLNKFLTLHFGATALSRSS